MKERELETGQRIYWRSWSCCFWSCINIIHTFPCNKTTNTNAQSLRDKEREKIIIKKERKKERRLINSHDLSLFNDPFKTKVTIICFFLFFERKEGNIIANGLVLAFNSFYLHALQLWMCVDGDEQWISWLQGMYWVRLLTNKKKRFYKVLLLVHSIFDQSFI